MGRPPKLSTLSPWALKAVGLFVPEAREVPEMLYQWQGPFVLDDAAFRARFGAGPTPMEEVVEQTIAWARETYAPARAA